MSVAPVKERTPRMPTAITRVMPSCLRRRRRKRARQFIGLLPQGVPEDDVVNEAPRGRSLVRGDVDREVDVELCPAGGGLGGVREDVVVRDEIGDRDRRVAALR